MTLIERIGEYVDEIAPGQPILAGDIYTHVAKAGFTQRDVFNEYLTRYLDTHPDFLRYRRGIYYKTVQTPFGRTGIGIAALVERIYVKDNGERFGYETGPSLMHKLGLTTMMPGATYIATERMRYKILGQNDGYILVKPVTEVTQDNYRYLQLLDILDNRYEVEFDVADENAILRAFIDDHKLDFERLVYYATKYRNKRVLARLAKLARGEKR